MGKRREKAQKNGIVRKDITEYNKLLKKVKRILKKKG